MKLVLERFSQEASLSSPDDIQYYLVLKNEETGKTMRLRVQPETVNDLISEVYGTKTGAPTTPKLEEPEDVGAEDDSFEHPEGADVFGGDQSEYDEQGWEQEEEDEDEYEGPNGEDEVPSL